jgi:predicted nucleic acid-binding protein
VTVWVVNTSPLIFLAKLGRLDRLRQSAQTIFVPTAVLSEILAKPDEASEQIGQAVRSWLNARRVHNRDAVAVLLGDLQLGEAEVIVLGREVAASRVVMDDLDARRLARRLGLDVVGTVGLLLAAHLRGEIGSVAEEIKRLEGLGFRVSSSLVAAVLRETREKR